MAASKQIDIEMERIKGDIALIRQSIHTIEFNHLKHLQNSISTINKILAAIGFLVASQLVIAVRQLLS